MITEDTFFWSDENGEPIQIAPRNPVALLDLTTDQASAQRIFTNFGIDYNFHFLPELNLSFNYTYDQTDSDRNYTISNKASWAYGENFEEDYIHGMKNQLLESRLKYDKEFASSGIHLTALLGVSSQSFEDSREYKRQYYVEHMEEWAKTHSKQTTTTNLASVYGLVNLSWKERYLLNLSFRRDGSSVYADENRWSNYPAVAVGWNIHNENFLEESVSVSLLKIRSSYGITGNMNFPRERFHRPSFFSTDYLIHPDIVPERTQSFNLGIDYGFYENRLFGSVDFYSRLSQDVFTEQMIPVWPGHVRCHTG